MNSRRDFLKSAALTGAAAHAMMPNEAVSAGLPDFAKGAVELPPILTDVEISCNPAMKGKSASYFCDDAIWFLRDLNRQRPRSLFDTPFLAPLKECHDRYGLKAQINLFYRTDFFYGMDEFTLAEVTDAYKTEWQANKDWLRLGFHSLQEFPDYPWINIDYADVKKLFGMTFGEINRFAGDGVFTFALVPHWCPMSKDGCRALKDCGIKLMECSVGSRYQYDGERSRLPYGHGMKLEQNRKPETGFYWRDSRNTAITASICSYNHISPEQARRTVNTYNYVLDHDTGMRFKNLFGDAPVLNLCTPETLRSDTEKVLGRDYLVFSNHEQYFFKEYFAYQPDYSEKIRVMSKMMHDNGYNFIFIEDSAI
ncbi:MAG: twin-arginine translocation signal domain-containing protein [Kiritimatiellae bacterium]|nr:twin-arginine translocation signal domain-containing protein [Kiritimatiellia bacterium]MDD3544323.1 twin-arginine translocation signal domain-containing protein [Kiritimatiellia bacterium]